MNDEQKCDYNLSKSAMKNAYDPYSNFKVSAILTTKNGKKYSGVNIANQGIQSICAERVAFAKAISEGEKEFSKIMIIGGKNEHSLIECLPCGYCRQFMSEFVDNNFIIETVNNDDVKQYKIDQLLPYGFKL